MDQVILRKTAFAMPPTSPAFPPGPYRFVDREYFIIRYRTDPQALRRVVPEPLENHRAGSEPRIYPHAGFDRFRRLHRERPGGSGPLPGQSGG